jgi:hypothetical protein
MRPDAFEELRGANPVPGRLSEPAIEPLLRRLDQARLSETDPMPVDGLPRGSRWRRGLSALPIAGAVLVTLGVVVVVLIVVKHNPRQPSSTQPAVSSRQGLIDILGVLRRPQTHADLHTPVIEQYLRSVEQGGLPIGVGEPDVGLIRRATVTPWGSPVYLVPTKPPTAAFIARVRRNFPNLPAGFEAGHRSERLTEVDRGGAGGDETPAEIEAGQAISTQGAGRSFAGGSSDTRVIVIVPDGVARVSFVDPRQPLHGTVSGPVYRHSATVTVPVHGNVAAAQIDRAGSGPPLPMIWYSAGGAVIKRIGNFRTVNRVVSRPRPGPQTAQSRAAQRDPSTPNRVWVTPSSGDEHADYTVHFRVLLNDADYRYRVIGTRCSQITIAGGSGGGPGDARGRIWSARLDAVAGQTWCPGTYHVSVTVMDLGRYGNLQHPAHRFGTATYTVRR